MKTNIMFTIKLEKSQKPTSKNAESGMAVSSWRSERNQHTWPLLKKQFGNLGIQQYIVRSKDLQSLWKKYIGLVLLLRDEAYESMLERVITLAIEEWKKWCSVTSIAKTYKGHNFLLVLSHTWDAHPRHDEEAMQPH